MSAIYNFRAVSDKLACSGQPRGGQLASIEADGYQVVINLGLADAKYALANEAASVERLGLTYHHIPVLFDSPQLEDLKAFIGRMNEHAEKKILVHCAANYRASAFTGLYLLSAGKIDADDMTSFIEDVWQPDAVWQQFLDESIAYVKSS